MEADGGLGNFFDFTVSCSIKNLISKGLILELFCDMFECCPEQQLRSLFPIFENVVEGRGNRANPQFGENNLHTCTKICRSIMSKLTVTHDLQFRGTLQRFLAKSLPLTHLSGKQAL